MYLSKPKINNKPSPLFNRGEKLSGGIITESQWTGFFWTHTVLLPDCTLIRVKEPARK